MKDLIGQTPQQTEPLPRFQTVPLFSLEGGHHARRNHSVRSSAQRLRYLLSRLESLLSECAPGSWLRSMVYRQASQPWQAIRCGDPLQPVSAHVARFRREWTAVLREIASACPLVAESSHALLQLDPLSKDSDAAIERHVATIRPVLSDARLTRRLSRERDRSAFGSRVARFRK